MSIKETPKSRSFSQVSEAVSEQQCEGNYDLLAIASADAGRVHMARPRRVVRPVSAAEVADAVREAAREGIPVAARGQGHNSGGYALSPDGVVVDMNEICRVGTPDGDCIRVGGGASWARLLEHTLPVMKRPPVLPNHGTLTLGGVLSAGGIGDSTYRLGPAGNSVRELEVVTASGEIVRCSPAEHADLFDACLGGLGQFGIITDVAMGLESIPGDERLCRFLYADIDTFVADIALLLENGSQFAGMIGAAMPNTRSNLESAFRASSQWIWLREEEVPWLFVIDVRFRGDGVRELFSRLHHLPMAVLDSRLDYYSPLEAPGYSPRAHNAWVHAMIPVPHCAEFLKSAFAIMPWDREHDAPTAMYPLMQAGVQRPSSFQIPDVPASLVIDLMNVVPLEDTARIDRVVQAADEIWAMTREMGGRLYPVGVRRFSQEEWRWHLGARWDELSAVKAHWDPQGVFGRSVGAFLHS